MSRWFNVVDKLARSRGDESPSYYLIACVCGRQMTGSRTGESQVCYCAACGQAIFVLPRSAYPRPRGIPAESPSVSEIQFSSPGSVRPSGKSRSKSTDQTRESKPVAEPTAKAVIAAEREPVLAPRSKMTRNRLPRKWLTPLRMVLAGVMLVVGLTVWGSWRASRRHAAEQTLTASIRLAQQALEEDDLGEAARRFRDVRAALDLLGRTDSQSRELRQTAMEIGAAADLSRASLFGMLEEAVATQALSGQSAWSDTFRSSYRGEWVVIDALVTRVSHLAEGRRYEIEFPLSTSHERVRIVADLACFERAIPGGSQRRVIFAAQLEDFSQQVTLEETSWRVVLNPKTAFLWGSPENLARVGIECDDESKIVLAEQVTALGGEL